MAPDGDRDRSAAEDIGEEIFDLLEKGEDAGDEPLQDAAGLLLRFGAEGAAAELQRCIAARKTEPQLRDRVKRVVGPAVHGGPGQPQRVQIEGICVPLPDNQGTVP